MDDEQTQEMIDELTVELEYLRMLKAISKITEEQEERRKELETVASELGI